MTARFVARFLFNGRGLGDAALNKTKVIYRLADTSLQSDPSYERYTDFPCITQEPKHVALKQPFELYERQQKVVRKMLKIECGEVECDEIEMAENEMPGSTGLSVIAKASRTRSVWWCRFVMPSVQAKQSFPSL